jgi:hypothetical protein
MTFIADNQRKEEFKRQIVDGPSKFELMLALFDRNPRRVVKIVLDEGISDDGPTIGHKHELTITQVAAGSGRDESWEICGTLTFSVRGHGQSLRDSPRTFRGNFRTDNRKGSIVINPEGHSVR